MAFANNVDIDVSTDNTVEFGTKNQSIDYHINVKDNANLVINAPNSRPRLTFTSGGGLDITQGTVRINGDLNVLLSGTGFLNVSNNGSELYADDLYDSLSNNRRDGGYFNVSDGGKIHVKGTSRLTYERGNVSGEGSQVNSQTFLMGVSGGYGGDQFLSVNNKGEVNASKSLSLGYFDQRSATTLVVSEMGKISSPIISLSTNAELALGAKEGETAQSAGIIDAEKIEFVWANTSNKKLTLNHTSDNANISADISSGSEGLGNINALNGTTFLSGDNSGFSGKVKIAKNATLGVTQNLGTADISNSGKLLLNAQDDMVFANKVSGNGTISVGSGNVELSGDNTAFKGKINVESGAVATVSDQKNLGSAGLSVAGKLQLNSTSDWLFNHQISGSGILGVDTGNHAFSFKNSTATSGFTGALALQNTTFNLQGTNTDALAKAGLIAGKGSEISLGTGTQSIGSLAFSGGTIEFGNITPGIHQTDKMVNVKDQLDLTGSGAVQVNPVGVVDAISQGIDTGLSLMEQEDANAEIKLVSTNSATVVTGDAGNLQLQDLNGNAITDAVQHDISQDGQVVAKGTYDYRLTSGQNHDGLYVGYGLTQIELQGQGQNALILNANGKTGAAAELSSRLTGSGDLALDSQKGQTVSLSGLNNDYTGLTDLRSGNLLMLNDNVLGHTSGLQLAEETVLDMNGHNQTIGQLTGAVGSVLNINGGSLTISNGGTSAGALVGSGNLNIDAGTLNVNGSNASLSATTAIALGAEVVLDNVQGLGTGNIISDGHLNLNTVEGQLSNNLSGKGIVSFSESKIALEGDNSGFSGQFDLDKNAQLVVSASSHLGDATIHNQGDVILNSTNDWTMKNQVDGSGNVVKKGQGNITLTANSTYTGTTDIQQGGLILGQEDAPVTLASQQVNISSAGMLSGTGEVQGSINNAGLFVAGNGVSGSFTVGGDLSNQGAISLGNIGQSAGNQLVVEGNYHGKNGLINFDTVLGDDLSVTDKLIVKGDTTGNTNVSVTNAGGQGSQTLEGIELIHVDGRSDGEFTQSGRITAGAYDYSLVRGQGVNNSHWYLTSQLITPENPEQPEKPVSPTEHALRPEGGTYTANHSAVNTMFNTRLHDRSGKTQYKDVLTGEIKTTSMWMRHEGGHQSGYDGSSQLHTQSNRYVMQLGSDIAQGSTNGLDNWRLGIMAGYGYDNNQTRS
ncbi:MAG: autotransporter outer membrane beta-barrel domain-containing protein, partial [Acinetobacter sp.]